MQDAALQYDVLIAGAGPTGASCALALREAGLKVALLDKAVFPRDKVCGDALGGHVARILESLSPAYRAQFEAFARKCTIRNCRLTGPNLRFTDIAFSRNGYTSTRAEFDNFMFELAVRESGADIFTGTEIKSVITGAEKVTVKTAAGTPDFEAQIAIGCDGAHSVLAKQLAGFKLEPDHYCGAVRAYYENVAEVSEDRLEVYFLEGFLPGYFWIFPLPDNRANVGFGMLSRTIRDQKVDLKKSIPQIIEAFPEIGARFENAELLGKITGFGLPLGSRKRQLSGQRFMLCGDAASLIDPFSGEGIGNGMISARFAAEKAIACIRQQNFSAEFMHSYDRAVYEKLWKTLRTSYFFQRLLSKRTWLINLLITSANRNRFVKKWLHEAL